MPMPLAATVPLVGSTKRISIELHPTPTPDVYGIQVLKAGLSSLGYTVIGQPERSVVTFPTDAEWLAWCGQMIEYGVMVHRPQFPTLNHSESDVDYTLRRAAEIAGVRV